MTALLAGFQVSQALYAAAVLGVADHPAAGPAPVQALADHTGAHPPSLERLLRSLASIGVFTEPEPGVFALTPLGQTLTRSHPGSMRDLAIMWMETHYAPFGELTHTIRTGQPAAEHRYGQPFFTWLSAHPEQATRFTGAMANLTNGIKTAAIAALPVNGLRTIVDVGGADGTLLATLLTAHPQLRGVLFDLPHVIADARKTFAEHGVEDRAECAGGDFFDAVPCPERSAMCQADSGSAWKEACCDACGSGRAPGRAGGAERGGACGAAGGAWGDRRGRGRGRRQLHGHLSA